MTRARCSPVARVARLATLAPRVGRTAPALALAALALASPVYGHAPSEGQEPHAAAAPAAEPASAGYAQPVPAASTGGPAASQAAAEPPPKPQPAPAAPAPARQPALSQPANPTAAQPAGAARLTLSDVEALALAHNPTLAQANAQVEAAKGRATQAGLLPNPTIGYAGDDLSRARGDDVRGSHGFFVEQTIPLGGKLGRGREVFAQEARQADALVAAQRQRVLTAVRLAYREAVIADRRVAVREQLAQLAAQAVRVSSQLYNVGAADRPDTLEADIEARRAALALVEAQNARVRVWRQLGALLGDATFAPRPLAAAADDALPPLDQNGALASLLQGSPELQAARAGVARAEAGVGLAKRAQAPDLLVRAGSRYDRERIEPDLLPGGWGATVEVGVTVPLFNRNQGGRKSADADLTRARADTQRVELDLASRAAEALEQYDTARQTVALYRAEILPRAEEAYTLYRRSYEQMAAAYPQVLIAQRTWFQATDQYLDAIGRAWAAAIRLEGFLLDQGLDAPNAP